MFSPTLGSDALFILSGFTISFLSLCEASELSTGFRCGLSLTPLTSFSNFLTLLLICVKRVYLFPADFSPTLPTHPISPDSSHPSS